MEEELAKRLLQLFFKAPRVNALIVFEDNEYLGVVLKKDVEWGLRENNFQLFENINEVRLSDLPALVFTHGITPDIQIPIIDKVGNLIKIISIAEFNSQFYFERFIEKFHLDPIIENLDHPLIITNHFKKVIYLNREALEMAGEDILGHKLTDILKTYDIEITGDKMVVSRGDRMYHLLIHHSTTNNFSYQVYQFFLI